jgi:predicted metal-dependent phosphoesterase TrpH
MGSRVDLHAHTTASDGVLSPAALVELARARGIVALGVTDHDSTEGLAAALAAADSAVTVVPGVELSTDVPGGEIHVLGYFVDPTSSVLQRKLEGLREGRLRRGHRMVERLNAAGVPIRIERVLEIAGGSRPLRP